jgi:3-hydroxyisobutyrate dehydrogenase-like beta-hydroxyacid dehydrogenase
MKQSVGLVGLGLLGHAFATRLRAAGYALVGYDVVPACVERFTALGGVAAGSVADVARQADGVCTILPTLDSVEQVILGADGLCAAGRPGQTIIQVSTISPALTRRLAREVAARGLTFLDCPVSATSAMAAEGHGNIFVGGARAVYERWRPMLEAILPRSFYIGEAGQAMALKLVANLLIATHSAATAEALNLARRAGLDAAVALDVLKASAATSRMLEVRGPLMLRGEFPPQMKLDLFMKDLHLIQDAAKDAGAALPLGDVAERLYAAMQAAGHGGEDLSVVIRAIERPS